MAEFMIRLYHSLAEQNSSSADAADEQNECEAVENVLLGHSVLLLSLDYNTNCRLETKLSRIETKLQPARLICYLC